MAADQGIVKAFSPSQCNTSSPSPTATSQLAESPSLPPSPPSSCGSQSPPPKSCQESSSPRLLPSPPVCKNDNQPAKPIPLPFSIENILRPEFGSLDKRPSQPLFGFLSPEVILRTPPKTPEIYRINYDSPVDLSHKKSLTVTFPTPSITQNSTTKITSTTNNSKPLLLPTTGLQTKIIPSSTTTQNCSRSKYPENPEELANPKLPNEEMVWPAWVYCTRYSDRPSSGPRSRRIKRQERKSEEKRPRTAFTSDQLSRLKVEFETNKYLTEKRRQDLARELGLNESQIKIWFQNKRAKIKKTTSSKSGLAQHLIAQGLYNHSTMAVDEDDPYLN